MLHMLAGILDVTCMQNYIVIASTRHTVESGAYNDRSFYLELVAPMGRQFMGFMNIKRVLFSVAKLLA